MLVTWIRKDNKNRTITMDGDTLAEARAKIKSALKKDSEKLSNWVETS